MCGIVGIVGRPDAASDILAALKRLEYRGYDSAGIATLDKGHVERRRAVGKLSALTELLRQDPLHGQIGIGHTRWATHGAPNAENAHPHQAGPVAVVHNGIVENFRELRADLEAGGATFTSQTDTEVVAQLCASFLARGLGPQDAAAATLARLKGAFALCFLFEGEDNLMIAARRGSPLAIGHGQGEMFVGSDALALAPLTDRITYLEEGDWAVLTRDTVEIYDAMGNLANREQRIVSVDAVLVDKGTHRHFMAKEIHEQPSVLAYALSHYLDPARKAVDLPGPAPDFAAMDRLLLVACGTAYYACHVAKYWFEQIARIPVEIDVASEFRYRNPPIGGRDGAIFVSQSGETADTLAALRYVRDAGGHPIAVVNVAESSIARESDQAFEIKAGPEIGVASTKAFTCQLIVLAALAITAGRQRGTIVAAEEERLVTALARVPAQVADALGAEAHVSELARDLAKARDILFLGRGPMYPLALEGALKLKEISYIHAEGYASGELKHGPIALVDDSVPVICFAPMDPLFDKTVSNMQEVMARGGRVLLASDTDGLAEAADGAWATLSMPACDPVWAPIVYAVPAQLLAYHTAVEKGTDVDQPRNLAKSVTVE
ncbi:glutamine--fructose-6-phosphate transaminase (isomerizing) [Oceanomicrobium pacificus]|uniref:Glutamine--fructose-6-phosphate aminotransferase [isomerizing] n=1 Tax=Oceanomicrobium pacificus TaxID=2692916 RepID=A0A6B0TU12_9RHOB|nr:glutamine--fructose-6-phosphate transaminase (isomerizing) [Oceanomicrobium pacificus]MXU65275.1 glutamine--fructose-6-phosphate transaminase (isomerizing) [Oceanomicrobium pacificus]